MHEDFIMTVIVHHTPEPSSTDPEPTTNFMRTSKVHALRIITRAMEDGDIVHFKETTLRYLRKGAEFQEGDDWFEALETGCFLRLSVWEGKRSLDESPSSYRWGVYPGQLDDIIEHFLNQMSPYEQECLVQNSVLRNVMREENRDKSRRREQCQMTRAQQMSTITQH